MRNFETREEPNWVPIAWRSFDLIGIGFQFKAQPNVCKRIENFREIGKTLRIRSHTSMETIEGVV